MRRATLAASLLLASACAWPPWHEPTLCERPARPAASAGDPAVTASFRAFADSWLERLRKARAGAEREIGDEVETELRPTGDARSPWVGVLRYCERGPGGNTVVSELFRYEAGEWVD